MLDFNSSLDPLLNRCLFLGPYGVQVTAFDVKYANVQGDNRFIMILKLFQILLLPIQVIWFTEIMYQNDKHLVTPSYSSMRSLVNMACSPRYESAASIYAKKAKNEKPGQI